MEWAFCAMPVPTYMWHAVPVVIYAERIKERVPMIETINDTPTLITRKKELDKWELQQLRKLPLNKLVAHLREQDWQVSTRLAPIDAFDDLVEDLAKNALAEANEEALYQFHHALFLLYELHVSEPGVRRNANQFDVLLTHLKNRLESFWLDHERERLLPAESVITVENLVDALKEIWRKHPAAKHELFDYLERDASLSQLRTFFRSDSALNIRFFDLIVMAMVGSVPEAREELSKNFWDEAGRGDACRSHVALFRKLLDSVGIDQAEDDHAGTLTWQGLAGYNLFMLAAINRKYYFMSLGIMSMTELLDPSQYERLVNGCRRVGMGVNGELEYYEEHVTIDVVHGEGWLKNVITPIVERNPEAASDIILGASLRLKTCLAYYDTLLSHVKAAR